MATTVVASSNTNQKEYNSLMKRIQVEQNFANQAYANFKSVKFGISACCYTDFEDATINKELCDWQNSASTKIVVATKTAGVFVEPLASRNTKASMSCPTTPTNVCTILDLEKVLAASGTYSQCFDIPSANWTITHNLGKFPSVTVVDSTNTLVVGNVVYTNSNIINITFNSAFAGCVFLN